MYGGVKGSCKDPLKNPAEQTLILSLKGDERLGWFPRSGGKGDGCCFISVSSSALGEMGLLAFVSQIQKALACQFGHEEIPPALSIC